MTRTPLMTEPTEALFSLAIDLIPLEPDQIAQAQQLSQVAIGEAQRWQTYLNALSLLGFEQWLTERSALQMDWQGCSLCRPGYAALLPAVTHIQVGPFQICLVAVEGDLEQIELPRAVVELPAWMAHFYVVMEVWEELQMTKPWGFLRHDQLMNLQQQNVLTVNSDWTVTLPLNVFEQDTGFEQDTDRLLLHLRCLDAVALPLPASDSAEASPLQADLLAHLSNWQPAQTPLWQILDWQQGAALFNCPELVDWLVQPRSPQWQDQLSTLFQFFAQPVINVGRWLNHELDSIAQSLNWVLLPPLAAAAFRHSTDSANLILTQLDRLQVTIPAEARSGYQDFSLGDLPLRLYAITWSDTVSDGTPEWSLVVVLTAQAEQQLPSGLQLQVRDVSQILVERYLTEFMPDAHLYARVIGTYQEKFLVTVTYSDFCLSLPPFAFAPVSCL